MKQTKFNRGSIMSEDNIIKFPGKPFENVDLNNQELTPDEILENAIGSLDGVLILGRINGTEEYYTHSGLTGSDILWLLERSKQQLMAHYENN